MRRIQTAHLFVEVNLGVPTVTMKLEIDLSGIVRLPGAEAVFEEIVQYNETKVVPVNTTEPEGKEANETETASAKKNTTTITVRGKPESLIFDATVYMLIPYQLVHNSGYYFLRFHARRP